MRSSSTRLSFPLNCLVAALLAPTAFAQTPAPAAPAEAPAKSLGMVTVTSGQPTSLPTQAISLPKETP